MIIIIDAYNLAGYLFRCASITAHQRDQFNTLLRQYARRKKHTLIAVYDGGPMPWPTQERVGNVTTIFSGTKSTADDEIISFLSRRRVQGCLLITADRKLRQRADRLGVTSLSSHDFAPLVQPPPRLLQKRSSHIRKLEETPQEESTEELDRLMREAALDLADKPELADEMHQPKHTEPKLSKKERALEKLLKKL